MTWNSSAITKNAKALLEQEFQAMANKMTFIPSVASQNDTEFFSGIFSKSWRLKSLKVLLYKALRRRVIVTFISSVLTFISSLYNSKDFGARIEK